MTNTIYYVCKYTPLELLEGFGLPFERLDPAPASFECADSCAHPNLCGYGKAVLEEVFEKGIDSLLLADCCDVCRRIYDVLQNRGNMKFLFLFSLPHKNGKEEALLMKKELHRLSEALEKRFGCALDLGKAFAAWRDAAQDRDLKEPHILLTGAHGGRVLLDTIRERTSLPVADGTCTGNRRLPAPRLPDSRLPAPRLPAPQLPAPAGDDFYAGYADALLGQEHPCMRMQFCREESDPYAAGVICHTVKFCDYYGFAYRHRRGNCEVPLLKIETDSTPQSGGQLHTRLDAFNETIMAGRGPAKEAGRGSAKEADRGPAVAADRSPSVAADRGPSVTAVNSPSKTAYQVPPGKKGAIRYVAGVDSGSASTDAVILDRERRIIGSAVLATGAGAAAGAKKALDAALARAGLQLTDLDAIVTTGYGRESIGVSDTSVTEITCHARGAHFLYPKARTVIDIGGQDSKVIRIDETGAVINFVMNDKCAAGTGRFLDMMARTMELDLAAMSEMGLHWKNEIAISSMCTVFAESEVVSLIAQNTPAEDIIRGLNMAVAGKTISLVHRLGGEPAYIMTGGVAQNQGVVRALEEKLGASVYVREEAQLCGALGAALIALDRTELL